MPSLQSRVCCVLRAVVGGIALAGAASAEPPPLEHFFAAPELTRFRISPDGSYASAVVPTDDDWRLALIRLSPIRAVGVVKSKDRPIFDSWWANDDRVLMSVSFENGREARLVAANRDATSVRDFAVRLTEQGRSTTSTIKLVHALPADPENVLVSMLYRASRSLAATQVVRFNVHTGAANPVAGTGVRVRNWWADPDGELRLRYARIRNTGQYSYRQRNDPKWIDVEPVNGKTLDIPRLIPLGFDSIAAPPIVASRHDGDRYRLYRYSGGDEPFSAPFFEHPEVDVAGPALVSRDGRLRGVRYHTDGWQTYWLDPEWRRRAEKVARAVPDVSLQFVDWDAAEKKFILLAESERRPPLYLLYTEEPPSIKPLASLHPELDPDSLVASRPVRYKARDGTSIPGYLTLPRGKGGPVPLVVLIHDGPWTADGHIRWHHGHATIGFDPEVQFLVSRGWAVFRPNYRGSGGLGLAHEEAGFQRWGLEMQDDLEDGVRALIAQGVVDPKRVCLFGHGYGGYAALEGAAKTPDLYRCAAAHNGVYDLREFAADTDWFVYDEEVDRRITGEASRLVETSPAKHAERILAPVLLVYGKEAGPDWIWAEDQFERMQKALEKAGRPPEVLRLGHDGEALGREENRLAFYGSLERFFRKHLDPGD